MIRLATPDDLPMLAKLGAAMHRESNYSPLDYSYEGAMKTGLALMESPDGFVCVAERDHELVGFILGFASAPWFGSGKQKTACDMGLYVRPENRRGASAIQLVEAYRKWALDLGCVQVRAGTNAGSAGQAANAIYEHFGFARSGYCFVLNNFPRVVGQTFDHHLAVQ